MPLPETSAQRHGSLTVAGQTGHARRKTNTRNLRRDHDCNHPPQHGRHHDDQPDRIIGERTYALYWKDIHLLANLVRVSGEAPRSALLEEPFRSLLISRRRVDEDSALVVYDNVQDHELGIAKLGRPYSQPA